MDLAQLGTIKKANEGVFMDVRHPQTDDILIDKDAKESVAIKLLGTDSEQFLSTQYQSANKRIAKAAKKGKLQGSDVRAEDIDKEHFEQLLDCTVGWRHVQLDGQDLPFNRENARKLYERLPFLKDQAYAFIGDRANFLGNS